MNKLKFKIFLIGIAAISCFSTVFATENNKNSSKTPQENSNINNNENTQNNNNQLKDIDKNEYEKLLYEIKNTEKKMFEKNPFATNPSQYDINKKKKFEDLKLNTEEVTNDNNFNEENNTNNYDADDLDLTNLIDKYEILITKQEKQFIEKFKKINDEIESAVFLKNFQKGNNETFLLELNKIIENLKKLDANFKLIKEEKQTKNSATVKMSIEDCLFELDKTEKQFNLLKQKVKKQFIEDLEEMKKKLYLSVSSENFQKGNKEILLELNKIIENLDELEANFKSIKEKDLSKIKIQNFFEELNKIKTNFKLLKTKFKKNEKIKKFDKKLNNLKNKIENFNVKYNLLTKDEEFLKINKNAGKLKKTIENFFNLNEQYKLQKADSNINIEIFIKKLNKLKKDFEYVQNILTNLNFQDLNFQKIEENLNKLYEEFERTQNSNQNNLNVEEFYNQLKKIEENFKTLKSKENYLTNVDEKLKKELLLNLENKLKNMQNNIKKFEIKNLIEKNQSPSESKNILEKITKQDIKKEIKNLKEEINQIKTNKNKNNNIENLTEKMNKLEEKMKYFDENNNSPTDSKEKIKKDEISNFEESLKTLQNEIKRFQLKDILEKNQIHLKFENTLQEIEKKEIEKSLNNLKIEFEQNKNNTNIEDFFKKLKEIEKKFNSFKEKNEQILKDLNKKTKNEEENILKFEKNLKYLEENLKNFEDELNSILNLNYKKFNKETSLNLKDLKEEFEGFSKKVNSLKEKFNSKNLNSNYKTFLKELEDLTKNFNSFKEKNGKFLKDLNKQIKDEEENILKFEKNLKYLEENLKNFEDELNNTFKLIFKRFNQTTISKLNNIKKSFEGFSKKVNSLKEKFNSKNLNSNYKTFLKELEDLTENFNSFKEKNEKFLKDLNKQIKDEEENLLKFEEDLKNLEKDLENFQLKENKNSLTLQEIKNLLNNLKEKFEDAKKNIQNNSKIEDFLKELKKIKENFETFKENIKKSEDNEKKEEKNVYKNFEKKLEEINKRISEFFDNKKYSTKPEEIKISPSATFKVKQKYANVNSLNKKIRENINKMDSISWACKNTKYFLYNIENIKKIKNPTNEYIEKELQNFEKEIENIFSSQKELLEKKDLLLNKNNNKNNENNENKNIKKKKEKENNYTEYLNNLETINLFKKLDNFLEKAFKYDINYLLNNKLKEKIEQIKENDEVKEKYENIIKNFPDFKNKLETIKKIRQEKDKYKTTDLKSIENLIEDAQNFLENIEEIKSLIENKIIQKNENEKLKEIYDAIFKNNNNSPNDNFKNIEKDLKFNNLEKNQIMQSVLNMDDAAINQIEEKMKYDFITDTINKDIWLSFYVDNPKSTYYKKPLIFKIDRNKSGYGNCIQSRRIDFVSKFENIISEEEIPKEFEEFSLNKDLIDKNLKVKEQTFTEKLKSKNYMLNFYENKLNKLLEKESLTQKELIEKETLKEKLIKTFESLYKIKIAIIRFNNLKETILNGDEAILESQKVGNILNFNFTRTQKNDLEEKYSKENDLYFEYYIKDFLEKQIAFDINKMSIFELAGLKKPYFKNIYSSLTPSYFEKENNNKFAKNDGINHIITIYPAKKSCFLIEVKKFKKNQKVNENTLEPVFLDTHCQNILTKKILNKVFDGYWNIMEKNTKNILYDVDNLEKIGKEITKNFCEEYNNDLKMYYNLELDKNHKNIKLTIDESKIEILNEELKSLKEELQIRNECFENLSKAQQKKETSKIKQLKELIKAYEDARKNTLKEIEQLNLDKNTNILENIKNLSSFFEDNIFKGNYTHKNFLKEYITNYGLKEFLLKNDFVNPKDNTIMIWDKKSNSIDRLILDQYENELLTEIIEFKEKENITNSEKIFIKNLKNGDIACYKLKFRIFKIGNNLKIKVTKQEFDDEATKNCKKFLLNSFGTEIK